MVGSTQSTSGPNFVLNTIVADVLAEIADKLESAKDVHAAAQEITQTIARDHKRIIFNGDNYSEDWVKEAEKRGLPNIRNAVDSIKAMLEPGIAELFEKHAVLSKEEWHARIEILLERYCKEINIEAQTAAYIAKRNILPAVMEYAGMLANSAGAVKALGVCADVQVKALEEVCALAADLQNGIAALDAAIEKAADVEEVADQADAYRDVVIPAMNAVRVAADKLETIVDAEVWPLPTYAEMLFLR
jgi:glutamine synthetase